MFLGILTLGAVGVVAVLLLRGVLPAILKALGNMLIPAILVVVIVIATILAFMAGVH